MEEPIRVLHIVTYMGRGGLETMLMNYYRHIDRSKIQFDFLVHRDFEADYDTEILKLGGRIYHISRLIPWSINYKKQLKSFFKNHPEYKIVHVHQDCLSSVALKCAQECGIPVRIAHSHNSNQDKNIKYIIKKHYMKTIPIFATELLACSKEAGDWMFHGESYQILYNAIDAKNYQYNVKTRNEVRKRLNIENNFVVGHVGRLRKQKNHDFLIDIFNEIHKKVPSTKLLLIGDGDEINNINKKVNQLSLSNDALFLGARDDVNHLLQAMDCFVMPSLYEGLSLAIIEAQASGLPCFISNNVSNECIKTNLVKQLSLNDSPKIWAQEILKSKNTQRTDKYQEIVDAGFDVMTNVESLQNYYLEKLK